MKQLWEKLAGIPSVLLTPLRPFNVASGMIDTVRPHRTRQFRTRVFGQAPYVDRDLGAVCQYCELLFAEHKGGDQYELQSWSMTITPDDSDLGYKTFKSTKIVLSKASSSGDVLAEMRRYSAGRENSMNWSEVNNYLMDYPTDVEVTQAVGKSLPTEVRAIRRAQQSGPQLSVITNRNL